MSLTDILANIAFFFFFFFFFFFLGGGGGELVDNGGKVNKVK